MDTSDLAKRMKDYESISKTKLMKRCPVICRIDGKAHHTFTRGFQRPYDEIYMKTIQQTTQYLCEHLQGVVLSYQQSDEITLVFVDYHSLNVSPYFDYEVQKLCSVIASMTTVAFNKFFVKNMEIFYRENTTFKEYEDHAEITFNTPEAEKQYEAYIKAYDRGAMFDARVFNIPKEEVTNCVYWRQIDAVRNSVQMLGQAYFSEKQLDKKSQSVIIDMLEQKGVSWREKPIEFQRGSCCIKEIYYIDNENGTEMPSEYQFTHSDYEKVGKRTRWVVDRDIPIFKESGREYIDKLVFVGE